MTKEVAEFFTASWAPATTSPLRFAARRTVAWIGISIRFCVHDLNNRGGAKGKVNSPAGRREH